MPSRYPPEAKPLEGKRSKKDSKSQSRIVTYAEPETSLRRRVARLVVSPPVIIPAVVLATIVVGFLVYYWTIFSRRIDNLLKGEVFTRSAGIYAAPKQLRVNETISEEEVIAFLKHAGYVEKGQQADNSRGRYIQNGVTVEVEPSSNSTVD